ncbi:hypothetical protein EK21DRAFT_88305 [Setomelanomma holmii]|uniref:Uncharacterized protein n=1 Tax=Setomelanomma holmii TaxID=210430 RepID=A0A9P4LL66_9PLEO|nr:hypothetical protein EK21DRAFT_88305 [Setomelanomma holmii]
MAASTTASKDAPAPKRRKLSLNATLRVRNGGSTDSFIPSTAPALNTDDGSDTEEEHNSALEEEYLNRMAEDTDKKVETVFGKDLEVWKSFRGTVYADINDRVKQKMCAQELWTEEKKAKVHVGSKRKAEEITTSFKDDDEGKKTKGKGKAKKEPSTPIPAQIPTSPYPPRSPSDTIFHHGSAGIDPAGAHARPLKPLPKRKTAHSTPLSGLGHVGMEGLCRGVLGALMEWWQDDLMSVHIDSWRRRKSPPSPAERRDSVHSQPHKLQPILEEEEGEHHPSKIYSTLSSPGLDTRIHRPLPPAPPVPQIRPAKIISGSFDEGPTSRFDERPYRLLPGHIQDVTKEEGKENKPNPFRGKPWLR